MKDYYEIIERKNIGVNEMKCFLGVLWRGSRGGGGRKQVIIQRKKRKEYRTLIIFRKHNQIHPDF